MNTSSVLGLLLVLLIVGSVLGGWYRYAYSGDFLFYYTDACDSEAESCFVWPECEEECAYKIRLIPADTLTRCSPDEGECLEQACALSGSCSTILCSEETRTEFGVNEECL